MRILLVLIVSLITFPALSAWQLDNKNSTLSFVSIKKNSVAEAHSFTQLSGVINDQGLVSITIDLGSVNTHIGIRDDRMKEHLFETSLFPKATFSTQLNLAAFQKLSVGAAQQMELTGAVDLHGQKQEITVNTLIIRLNEDTVIASTLNPFMIKAEAFKLVAGINKLQELAGLPSISQAVPVSFVVTFKQ
ncbi:MAG: polyisoprenoid-binding protein YceI [Alteromonadaceae bacterium]|jgi:polyisoprenoid-binding protein YceI